MIFSALRNKDEPCLQALAASAAHARSGAGFNGSLCCAKWTVAVLAELAEPGQMSLIPLVGRNGQVSDFMWRRVSPTVTLMLGCAGEDLNGRTLSQVLAASALRKPVFEACHRAFLSRSRQTLVLHGGDWRGRLDVHPWAAGLTAVLTSTTAIARLVAARRVLRELEMHPRSGADTTIAYVT